MRSNWRTYSPNKLKEQVREVAREEIAKQKAEVCSKCEESITNQVVAILCKVMHDRFGFGKKRILDLLSLAKGFSDYIKSVEDATTLDAVRRLKEEYGIDLNDPKYEEGS